MTLFAIVFGIGLGGEYMVIPLMAAELFGTRVLGRAMGIVLAADGVAEALAPVLVGRLRDTSGSYVTGFSVLIAFAVDRRDRDRPACRDAAPERRNPWPFLEPA